MYSLLTFEEDSNYIIIIQKRTRLPFVKIINKSNQKYQIPNWTGSFFLTILVVCYMYIIVKLLIFIRGIYVTGTQLNLFQTNNVMLAICMMFRNGLRSVCLRFSSTKFPCNSAGCLVCTEREHISIFQHLVSNIFHLWLDEIYILSSSNRSIRNIVSFKSFLIVNYHNI